MKKILAYFLFVFLLCTKVMAYDFTADCVTGQTLSYTITSDTIPYTVALVRGDEYVSGDLEIPASVEYNDIVYSVTAIADSAFYQNYALTSVIVPNTVTSIGDAAFYFCGLRSASVPTSVTSFGSHIFYGNNNLSAVYNEDTFIHGGPNSEYVIPDGIKTICQFAFSSNQYLTTITIPSSVTYIGQHAFSYCSALTTINYNVPNCIHDGSEGYSAFFSCNNVTTINIGENVEVIPQYMFATCSGLTSITLPNSLREIGERAFSETGLTSITIPENITSMGSGVFYRCTGLTTVNFNATNCSISGINLYVMFLDCPVTTVNIGENVTSIPDEMFYVLESLQSVTIPENVTSIGKWAFANCTNLTTVNFNATNCTYMGTESQPAFAFNWTSTLTTLNIGENVTRIPNYAFAYCTNLSEITIPASVTNIGDGAFTNCSSLTTVNYNAQNCTCDGTTVAAFRSCSNITTINIGENVEVIPQYIFHSCSGVTSITFPNSLREIGERAFYGCGLESVTIVPSLTNIGSEAFKNCSSLTAVNYNAINCTVAGLSSRNSMFGSALTSLTFAENVKTIPGYAFYNCSGLTGTLILPDSLESIGYGAFSGCTGYTGTLTIPESVTSFENSVFSNCTGLTSLVFNATNCTAMGFCFSGCTSLTSLTIGENVTNIPDYAFRELGLTGTLTIPESVTSIGEWAFYGCSGLSEIVIGNSVASIGNSAFRVCAGLTSLTIPNSVTSIGYWAFADCSNLTTVNFNATNCTSMGESSYPAFGGCPSFSTLHIAENVTEIPGLAFFDCENITDIYVYSSTPPTIENSIAFTSAAYSNATVWTPCPAAATYRSDSQWGEFVNISNEQTSIFNIAVQTADASMGDVAGDGSFTCDTEVTLTATPNDGYRFVAWNDGNEDNPRTITVGGDSTFVASFRAVHTITATAGANGTISPSGEVTIDEGSDQSFTITPNTNYRLVNVIVDGSYDVTGLLVDGIYTFVNVVTDHTITATFEAIPSYTISVTGGSHGTISPSSDVIVIEGGSQTFTFSPDACYDIGDVRVDGATVRLDENNSYTFTNVTADHTVEATFVILTYTIAVTSSEHGSVTHNDEEGDVVVNCGDSQSFTIVADDSCRLVSVMVDGVNVTSQLVNGVYTFTNVTADHTISATFEEIPIYTITVSASNDEYGTVAGGGEYMEGTVATISATPNENCHFVSWNDGSTENPRTFTVMDDNTFVATFERNLCTITALASDPDFGTVTGGGQYAIGDTVVLTATPGIGFCFISWDDDSLANPRSFVAAGDSTFVAEFSATAHRAVDTTVTSYLTLDEHTFYASGIYSYVIPSDIGCDTIVDLTLQVLDVPETYDISPNPAKSLICISLENYISYVEFYTIGGRLVMQKEVNANSVEINVEGLVSGVYFVRLYGECGHVPLVQRFVKE